MDKFIDWVKQHPYLAGSVVIGVIVLLYLLFSSSSSSAASTTPATTTTDPNASTDLAAELQQQQQILGYNSGIASLDAQTQVSGQTLAGQQVQAQLTYQQQLQQILSGQEVSDNSTAAALQLGLAQTGVTSSQYFSSNGTANETLLTYNGNTSSAASPNNNVTNPPATVINLFGNPPTVPINSPSTPIVTTPVSRQPLIEDPVVGNVADPYGTAPLVTVPGAYGGSVQVPSSTGLDWQQYTQQFPTQQQSFDPATVASEQGTEADAEYEYLNNPYSLHNLPSGDAWLNGVIVPAGTPGSTTS
jgi:hypothetical protein